VDLAHVLWIGGPQGSGKTSVARALSRRFDLQLYIVDRRTWVHEPRMPSTEFGSLSMDERWVDAAPARMLDWFLGTSRHRFRLVLEDLRALPDSPLAVVEGPQLFPTSVAAVLRAPENALFLLPDLDEQRERLRARGPMLGVSDGERARANATERDLLITRRFGWEAADLRLKVLRVDAADRKIGLSRKRVSEPEEAKPAVAPAAPPREQRELRGGTGSGGAPLFSLPLEPEKEDAAAEGSGQT